MTAGVQEHLGYSADATTPWQPCSEPPVGLDEMAPPTGRLPSEMVCDWTQPRGAALIPAVLLYSIHTNITNNKLIKSFPDSPAQLPRETLPRRASFPCNTPPPQGLGSPPISLSLLRETPYSLSGLPCSMVWVSSGLPRRAGVPNGLYSSVWR